MHPIHSSERIRSYFPFVLMMLVCAVECTAAVGWHRWCLYWKNHGYIGQVTCGAEKRRAAAVNQAVQIWSSSSGSRGDRQGGRTAAYWFSHCMCVDVCVWMWGLDPFRADKASRLKAWEHWVCTRRGWGGKRRSSGDAVNKEHFSYSFILYWCYMRKGKKN